MFPAGTDDVITILATICLGTACKDVVVTSSLLDNRVTLTSCQMGAPELAEWMSRNWPGYRFAGWKCVIGRKGEAT